MNDRNHNLKDSAEWDSQCKLITFELKKQFDLSNNKLRLLLGIGCPRLSGILNSNDNPCGRRKTGGASISNKAYKEKGNNFKFQIIIHVLYNRNCNIFDS